MGKMRIFRLVSDFIKVCLMLDLLYNFFFFFEIGGDRGKGEGKSIIQGMKDGRSLSSISTRHVLGKN